MSKLWIIAGQEYAAHVRRRTFLLTTLGFPLLLVLVFGLIIVLTINSQNVKAIGYVDHAGILRQMADRVMVPPNPGPTAGRDAPVPAIRYPDEAAARQALDGKQIDVYFVLPADYRATGKVVGYAPTSIPQVGQDRFTSLLRQGLLAAIPGHDPRLAAPIGETVNLKADGQPNNPAAAILVPFLFAFLFYLASYIAGSYLMQSVAEEKESRVMEILATSVRPGDLMGGKIVGLGLVGLTQMAVWVGIGLLTLWIGAAYVPFLVDMALPWDTVLLIIVLFVPSYLLYAASLAAVGAAVTARQEGQQLSGIFSLLGAVPIWFFVAILTDPNGPLALGLSFFPYTAPMTLLLRQAAMTVPIEQIVLSWVITTAAALGMVWVAGRVMRFGMLRYGKRLGLRELGQALRGA
jgi:ABC-2 type transport system permease protein